MLAGLLLLSPALVLAQSLRLSPDITVVLAGVTVHDESVVQDLIGAVSLVNVGPLPAGADVIAYHLLPSTHALLAFDTTVVLSGVTFEPGDVARFDGAGYSLEFDASAAGVPPGTRVDAVSMDGVELVLSFDVTVTLGGVTYDDADLVAFDGSGFALAFDSAAAGVAGGLDLDGAHVLPAGALQVSFDASGIVAGVAFDDEDVLERDSGGGWSLAYDGSAQHGAWPSADLDALGSAVAPLGLGGDPALTRAERVLFTAAEQAVSLVAGITDSRGCFSVSGSLAVRIEVDAVFAPQVHFLGETDLEGLVYHTAEQANDSDASHYLTFIPLGGEGTVLGAEVSALSGAFTADGAFGILYGAAGWFHGAAEISERLIKDFYAGLPRPPRFADGANGPCPPSPGIADLLSGACVVSDPGDHNPDNPFAPVRVVRDNGLEVTAKAVSEENLLGAGELLVIGGPKGKWRQTSFYREPNGPGEGRLVYTKVRIAPFGAPACALQLDGVVDETVDNPVLEGTISVFPLGL